MQKRPKITDSDHEGEDLEEVAKEPTGEENENGETEKKGVIDSSDDEGVEGG